MKKQIYLLLSFFVLMALSVFAQTDSTNTDGGIGGTGLSILQIFGSVTGVVLLTQIVTGWLTQRIVNNTVKQILSWVVGIGLSYLGYSKGLGIFAELTLSDTLLTGLGISIVANRLFDAGTLDNILILLFAKKRSV